MTHFSPGFITNPATGYTIENSVWFSSTSDTLTKTFSGAGDTQKAVISFWIKQCSAGANNKVFSSSLADAVVFIFNTNDEVRIRWSNTNPYTTVFLSDGQFRDYTAWQHFALAIDMTQATDTNRIKLYVNGVESTVNSTNYPAQFATFTWNTAIEHVIHGAGEAEFYLAEFISLDGQSIVGGDLAITDLVDTDSNGVPVPVDPSELTFGTNGFWLDFAIAPGTGAGSGNDVSGNNNDFTETSMTAAQQVTDSPTDDAENGIGNFATWSPLGSEYGPGPSGALTEGNTTASQSTGAWTAWVSTQGMSTGKWYAEFEYVSGAVTWQIGVARGAADLGANTYKANDAWQWYEGADQKRHDLSYSSYGTSLSVGQHFMVCFDADNQELYFGGNGTWFNSSNPSTNTSPAYSSVPVIAGEPLFFKVATHDTVSIKMVAEADWVHTVPTGAKALNTANLPAPTITDPSAYYQNHQYEGTGAAHDETLTGNASMDPDLVWIKNMDQFDEHKLVDTSRGATKELNSDSTNAETTDANGIDDLGVTNGFGLGTGAGGYNDNAETFIAWCLKESPTAGFSIVSSVSHTQGSATNVAHGLGAVPTMAFVKRTDSTGGWYVYHKSLASTTNGHLFLDTSVTEQTLTGVWGVHDTTNFVIGGGASAIATGTYVCYIWTDIDGFFATGTYTGNASADGPFVYTNFKPARVTIKGGSEWHTGDNARSPYNVVGSGLNLGDTGTAPATVSTMFDFTSNGFKLRTTNGGYNGASKYFWFAWAESPFGGSGVAQARAR
jgi:hypothetical protein